MENEIYKCICNNMFKEEDLEKHYSKCRLFKNQFKDFDKGLSNLLRNYFDTIEKKILGKFILKRYIKGLDKMIKNDSNFLRTMPFKKSLSASISVADFRKVPTDYEIMELKNLLSQKNKEIEQLKSKLNANSLDIINPGEKILAINFTSVDNRINYFLPCKNVDIFVRIEEKLYDEYPEYKDKETYFLCQGERIKRFKNLEENNIKNSAIIVLNLYE